MKEMMKTVVLITVLILTAVSAVAAPKSNKFDESLCGTLIEGHFKKDSCNEYAVNLSVALANKGYTVSASAIAFKDGSTHAFVFFKKDGKCFMMDNWMVKPLWVNGKTDLACAKSYFDGMFGGVKGMATDLGNDVVAPSLMTEVLK